MRWEKHERLRTHFPEAGVGILNKCRDRASSGLLCRLFKKMTLLDGYPKVSYPRDSNCNISHLLILKTRLCSWMLLSLQENWVESIESFQIPSPPISPIIIQFSSVAQSYLTLCDPMDCSTPGLPVHHQLPEFTLTHAHWVGDAIQPSHPLLSLSPPALNLSQHQGLFQWVSSLHQMAKVLGCQLQYQSCQWIFRTDFL